MSSGESIRPEDFPHSEEELQVIKKRKMNEVLAKRKVENRLYRNWLLKGSLSDAINITAMFAVYATPARTEIGYTLDPEVILDNAENNKLVVDYWKDISSLPFPNKLRGMEQKRYKDNVEKGDKILYTFFQRTKNSIIPSVMVVLGKSLSTQEQAAILVCPDAIPPSAAYRFIKEFAQKNSHLD